MIKSKHELSWCSTCSGGSEVVVCYKCGNNCCNGSHGYSCLVLKTDSEGNYLQGDVDWENSVRCDGCEEAYQHHDFFNSGEEIIFQRMYDEENEEWKKIID